MKWDFNTEGWSMKYIETKKGSMMNEVIKPIKVVEQANGAQSEDIPEFLRRNVTTPAEKKEDNKEVDISEGRKIIL